jgi:hypothetical protein
MFVAIGSSSSLASSVASVFTVLTVSVSVTLTGANSGSASY